MFTLYSLGIKIGGITTHNHIDSKHHLLLCFPLFLLPLRGSKSILNTHADAVSLRGPCGRLQARAGRSRGRRPAALVHVHTQERHNITKHLELHFHSSGRRPL